MLCTDQRLFNLLQQFESLLTAYGREIVKEVVESVPTGQVVDDCLDRDASAGEDSSTAHHFG